MMNKKLLISKYKNNNLTFADFDDAYDGASMRYTSSDGTELQVFYDQSFSGPIWDSQFNKDDYPNGACGWFFDKMKMLVILKNKPKKFIPELRQKKKEKSK